MRPARRRGMLSRNPLGMRPASSFGKPPESPVGRQATSTHQTTRKRTRPGMRRRSGGAPTSAPAAPLHRPPALPPRFRGKTRDTRMSGWDRVEAHLKGQPAVPHTEAVPSRRPHHPTPAQPEAASTRAPMGHAVHPFVRHFDLLLADKGDPAAAARWDRQRCSRRALPRPATGHPGGGSSRFSRRIRRIMRSRHADSAGTASSPYAASVAAAIPSITSSPNSGSVSRSPHSALKASP